MDLELLVFLEVPSPDHKTDLFFPVDLKPIERDTDLPSRLSPLRWEGIRILQALQGVYKQSTLRTNVSGPYQRCTPCHILFMILQISLRDCRDMLKSLLVAFIELNLLQSPVDIEPVVNISSTRFLESVYSVSASNLRLTLRRK